MRPIAAVIAFAVMAGMSACSADAAEDAAQDSVESFDEVVVHISASNTSSLYSKEADCDRLPGKAGMVRSGEVVAVEDGRREKLAEAKLVLDQGGPLECKWSAWLYDVPKGQGSYVARFGPWLSLPVSEGLVGNGHALEIVAAGN